MYKKLNQSGKEFIRTICNTDGADNDNMFIGRMKYDLPLSNTVIGNNGIESIIIDNDGNVIETNDEYATYLIYLFEFYANQLELDANVLAAQAYVESGYKSYYYDKSSSKCGISGLNSKLIYDYIVNGNTAETLESLSGLSWESDEIDYITTGITNPLDRNNYIYFSYENDSDNITIARNDRLQLLFNVASNPNLMIKAQANLFNEITQRNNYVLSSTLFSYSRSIKLKSKQYVDLLDKAGRKYGDTYTTVGIKYVESVFQALSDKNNDKLKVKTKKPKGISFGLDYNLNPDNFNSYLG